jgi:hypothetical protein
MNWNKLFNRIYRIINPDDPSLPTYFSGPRFISIIQQLDPDFPSYSEYVAERKTNNQSTSRKDFFRDIYNDFSPTQKSELIQRICNDLEVSIPKEVEEIRSMLNDDNEVPRIIVNPNTWNAERLNSHLAGIDSSIIDANYNRAVNLSYTCLEGFYKAFINQKIPEKKDVTEITKMSREIRDYIKKSLPEFPDELYNLINHSTFAVDRTRNGFSEAHFGADAQRWLASYLRDMVNSNIRLILNFI